MTTLQQPVRHTRARGPRALAPATVSVQVPVPSQALEPRAVTRARGLSDLLTRRPELSGVYLPADVATEAIRWSA